MRKIARTIGTEPDILSSDTLEVARKQIEQHFKLPDTERRRLRLQLNTSIFDDRGLLKAMEDVFGKHCAYCERALDTVWSRHVCHYRPTSNATSSENKSDSPDHYIWLAYTWENLLLLCEQCDDKKSNHFPVEADVRASPLSSWKKCGRQEKPLLLDPCVDAPEDHLQFSPDGFVAGKTDRGQTTIDILALNRETLVRARQTQFDQLISLIRSRSVKKDAPLLQESSPHQGAVLSLAFDIAKFAGVGRSMRSVLRQLDLADLLDWMAELSTRKIRNALAQIESAPSPASAEARLRSVSWNTSSGKAITVS